MPPRSVLDIDQSTDGALNPVDNMKALSLGTHTTPSQLMDLPPELVVEIFIFATLGKEAVTPLFLGKICREWRALVFESCALWQNIHLKLEYDRPSQLTLLKEWIDRSGSLPLSITVTYPNTGHGRPEYTESARFIMSLPPTRVSSLSLDDLPQDFFSVLVAAGPVGPWPILSHLHLSSNDADQDPDKDAPMFGEMPALKSLSVNHLYVLDLTLPWSQLLHIRLLGVYPYEIRGVLARAHNLLSLNASVVYGETHIPPLCLHQNLQNLTFSNTISKGSTFFNSLRLPALTSLTLELDHRKVLTGNGRERFSKFDMYPFLSESGCQLVDLSVSNGALVEKHVLTWLSALPSLRILRLFNNKWYEEANPTGDFVSLGPTILHQMTGSSEDSPILPILKQLTLEGTEVSFSQGVVIDFLRSRWGNERLPKEQGTTTLQSIVWKPRPNWTQLTEEQELVLGKWRVRGFLVDIQ
ncbi:hypothetical protein DFP72DRAFT_463087 [Ephemerocybe angulata]|uniref:F-box domain-containing protein n=1 Tax=Ephemerocybe angulata TaxID=980116 RepID=A0A8H6M1J3_9AGAR|nr:hypothetical protein DFP72DRAFT_463087 [Tulosesus angulatus]